MTAYYNENDPKAAVWLRELISAGLISPGEVDERSISEVDPNDVRGFTQCHFFAGIGGWSAALRLAGWGDDRAVWTGSCPCQPFSSAGRQRGAEDERHLWPVWFELIRECGPGIVFGEQVASSGVVGLVSGDRPASSGDAPVWLDGVSSDLETAGYTVGASVLGAHSVGSPHIRQRLWWVGSRLADSPGRGTKRDVGEKALTRSTRWPEFAERCGVGAAGRLGDAVGQRPQGHAGDGGGINEQRRDDAPAGGSVAASGVSPDPWSRAEWVECRDGKARRLEPGLAPLVDGLPRRLAQLRGLGNAIVPQVAAEFIRAYLGARMLS